MSLKDAQKISLPVNVTTVVINRTPVMKLSALNVFV